MKNPEIRGNTQENAPHAVNVMVVGETGQGKTVYARDLLRQLMSRPAGVKPASDNTKQP